MSTLPSVCLHTSGQSFGSGVGSVGCPVPVAGAVLEVVSKVVVAVVAVGVALVPWQHLSGLHSGVQ